MGYPDIIANVDSFLEATFSPIEFRPDSSAICKRHGLKDRPIPDAHSFFKLLGASLDVYDIVRERGCEILLDLNKPDGEEPYKANRYLAYDIVLDVGTAEHCFNIGQTLINMASMVKQGGYIIHENPANWGNHGFYNLNPTLFFDFYEQNGFQVEAMKLVAKDGRFIIPNPVSRFKFPNEEVNIFCIAQRINVQKLTYPIQTKYKNTIPAAEDRANVPPTNRAIGASNG